MGGSGVLHFAAPKPYDQLIPPFLGPPRPWVVGSGAVELACAAALVSPRARRAGAVATAAVLVAVFPGNVYMAVSPGRVPRWLALARLPLQVPLVLWAWREGQRAERA